ncbi:uncharacterized protein LOC121874780 [Homarus americanus]|uniref:uncharacterized protein LOC121874780 n=1 Tax=Homarus americanus TaxID=6706 RepID=UPI001C479E09|nr:uncharacterized protein LOC121874780 [Homarus americanus]
MEDVFRSLKSLQVTPVVTAKPVQDPSRAISKNLQALMLEQENDMKSRDPICQDLLQQMDEYDAELVKSQKDHEQILTRLNSLVKQNKLALQLQQEQRNIIQTMRKDFEEQRKQRNTIQECMTSVSTTQEALTAVEDLLSCLTGMKNWIQKCQELFPDVKAIHTSMKVREVSRMALDNVIMDDSSMEAIPVHLDTVIHEKKILHHHGKIQADYIFCKFANIMGVSYIEIIFLAFLSRHQTYK